MGTNGDVYNLEHVDDHIDGPLYRADFVSLPAIKLSATKSSEEIAQIDFTSDALIFQHSDTVEPVTLPQCHIEGQQNQNGLERQSSFNNGPLIVKKLLTSPATLLVGLLHIVVLIILLKLANNTVKHFVEVSNEQSLSNPNEPLDNSKNIKAYFLTAEQIRQLSNEQSSKEQRLEKQLSTEEQPSSTNLKPIEKIVKAEEQEAKLNETILKKVEQATEPSVINEKPSDLNEHLSEKQLPTKTMSDKSIQLPEIDMVQITNEEPKFKEALIISKFDWSSVDSIYLQKEKAASNEHMFNHKLFSDDGKDEVTIDHFSVLNSASHFFVNQYNQQQVIELISQQGHNATSSSGASVSELTPEMDDIELTIIEDKRQPTTLNHRLDPNRIVKLGETCYRVVPLPTQINPHAEGLGFAEPCDSGKMKRALNKAIEHRLSKVQLP